MVKGSAKAFVIPPSRLFEGTVKLRKLIRKSQKEAIDADLAKALNSQLNGNPKRGGGGAKKTLSRIVPTPSSDNDNERDAENSSDDEAPPPLVVAVAADMVDDREQIDFNGVFGPDDVPSSIVTKTRPVAARTFPQKEENSGLYLLCNAIPFVFSLSDLVTAAEAVEEDDELKKKKKRGGGGKRKAQPKPSSLAQSFSVPVRRSGRERNVVEFKEWSCSAGSDDSADGQAYWNMRKKLNAELADKKKKSAQSAADILDDN